MDNQKTPSTPKKRETAAELLASFQPSKTPRTPQRPRRNMCLPTPPSTGGMPSSSLSPGNSFYDIYESPIVIPYYLITPPKRKIDFREPITPITPIGEVAQITPNSPSQSIGGQGNLSAVGGIWYRCSDCEEALYGEYVDWEQTVSVGDSSPKPDASKFSSKNYTDNIRCADCQEPTFRETVPHVEPSKRKRSLVEDKSEDDGENSPIKRQKQTL